MQQEGLVITSCAPGMLVSVRREPLTRGLCTLTHDVVRGVVYVSQKTEVMIDGLLSLGAPISRGGFKRAVHQQRLYKCRYLISTHWNNDVPRVVTNMANLTKVVLIGNPNHFTLQTPAPPVPPAPYMTSSATMTPMAPIVSH